MAAETPYSLQEDNILIEIISKTPAIFNQNHEEYRNNLLKHDAWKNISNKVGRPTKSCKKRWRTIRDNYLKHAKQKKKGINVVKRHCGRKYPLTSMLGFLNSRATSEDDGTNDSYEGSDNLEDVEMDASSLLETINNVDTEFQEDNDNYDNIKLNSKAIQITNNVKHLPSINMMGSDESLDASMIDKDKTNFLSQVFKLIEKKNNEIELLLKHVIELTKTKELDDVDLFFKSMAITTRKMSPENIAKVKLKICQIVTEIEMQKN